MTKMYLKKCESVIHQSIKNKTDLISDTLCTYRFSIMFLTETWINTNDSDLHMKNATPNGYSFLHKPRSTGQLGGGIGAIVHNDIKYVDSSSEIQEYPSFEHMVLRTTHSGISVSYYLIYRPPPSAANRLSKGQFIPEFTDFLSSVSIRPGFMCILGDFNIHFDVHTDSERKQFVSLLSSLDLIQHVKGPTHSRGHTLDLIITKKDNKLADTTIGEMISDHNLVYAYQNFRKPTYQTKT